MEREEKTTEKDTVKIIEQLVKIVCYLNKVNLVHCDIRPNNILVNPATLNLKIIDFGSSSYLFEGDLLDPITREKEYAAPEVIKGCYGKECDMWSIGVIAFELLSGSLPFTQKKAKKLYRDMVNMKINLNLDDWERRSKEVKDFIKRLLQPNPRIRMSPAAALNHKWLKYIDEPEYDDYYESLLERV